MSVELPAQDPAPRTLDSQINWLFDTIRPEVNDEAGKRVPYSVTRRHHNNELAKHLGVTPGYVSQLKKGRKHNPTADVLRGIATFFGIPAAYFLSDPAEAARVEAEILCKVALRRFEDGEISELPGDSASSDPHGQLPRDMPDTSRPVCERLSWLFENIHSAESGRPYTDEDVAGAIGEKIYVVRGLRTGDMTDDDVTLSVLRKLAGFFDVPLGYLLGDEAPPSDPDTELLDLVRAIRTDKNGLMGVALRSLESPDTGHSGVRSRTTAEVLAKLIRVHLEADERMSQSAADRAGR